MRSFRFAPVRGRGKITPRRSLTTTTRHYHTTVLTVLTLSVSPSLPPSLPTPPLAAPFAPYITVVTAATVSTSRYNTHLIFGSLIRWTFVVCVSGERRTLRPAAGWICVSDARCARKGPRTITLLLVPGNVAGRRRCARNKVPKDETTHALLFQTATIRDGSRGPVTRSLPPLSTCLPVSGGKYTVADHIHPLRRDCSACLAAPAATSTTPYPSTSHEQTPASGTTAFLAALHDQQRQL